MLAPGKDKSLGAVTLPQLHSGRKRLGRSSSKSWEHMPASMGPGDTGCKGCSWWWQPDAHSACKSWWKHSLWAHSHHSPWACGPRLFNRRSRNKLWEEGILGAGGSWRMRMHTVTPLGSPQPAVLVVYNLMQPTVSTLRDVTSSERCDSALLYKVSNSSFLQCLPDFPRELKITNPTTKRYHCIYLFTM